MELRHQGAIHQAERSALLTNDDDLRTANTELWLMLGWALGTIDISVESHSRQLEHNTNDVTLLLQSLAEERSGHVKIALLALERALPRNDEAAVQQALAAIESEEPDLLKRLKNMAERTLSSATGFMLKELLKAQYGL